MRPQAPPGTAGFTGRAAACICLKPRSLTSLPADAVCAPSDSANQIDHHETTPSPMRVVLLRLLSEARGPFRSTSSIIVYSRSTMSLANSQGRLLPPHGTPYSKISTASSYRCIKGKGGAACRRNAARPRSVYFLEGAREQAACKSVNRTRASASECPSLWTRLFTPVASLSREPAR